MKIVLNVLTSLTRTNQKMIQSKIDASFFQSHCDGNSRCYPRCCDASQWNSPCVNFVRSSGGDGHLTSIFQKPGNSCESLGLKSIESVKKASATMPIGVVNVNRFTVFQQEGRGSMNTRVCAASFYQAETP